MRARPVLLWRLLAGLLVLAAVAAVYGAAGGLGFVDYDDRLFVLDNPIVAQGLTREGLVRAWTTAHEAQWQPIAWTSHMLDVELFGFDPRGHHLTSVVLHALDALLVLALGARLSGRLAVGLVAALLFAVHPLHVESVAWVSSRKDLLCLLFSLCTLLLWLDAPRERTLFARPGRYGAIALCHALALLSKPMAVTVPLLCLLLDLWPLGRWRGAPASWSASALPARDSAASPSARGGLSLGALLLEKLPLLALSAGAAAVVNALVVERGIPGGSRLATALVAYGLYLRRWVWPSDLTAFYPHPSLSVAGGWSTAQVLVGAALVALALVLALASLRRAPWRSLGLAWFLGALVPMLGLRQIAHHALADRYTYLPLLGLHLALAFELARARPGVRPVLYGAFALALGALVLVARAQVATWHDTRSLWTHALAVSEHNWVAHGNLGRLALAEGDLEQAERELHLSAAARPADSEPWVNLGVLEMARAQPQAALADFDAAREREPDSAAIEANRAGALLQLGRLDEAEAAIARALELDQRDASAWNQRGLLLEQRGERAEALAAFERALECDVRHPQANANLGRLLLGQGQFGRATDHLRFALERDPSLVEARMNLALALESAGRADEALASYEAALALDPSLALAHEKAAALRAERGDSAGQLAHLEALVALQPENFGAHHERGLALEALGRWPEAEQAYRRAAELAPERGETWNNLAGVVWRQGRLDEAAQLYRRGLEADPSLPALATNYGLSCEARGELAEAARWHARALELDPRSAASALSLAWIRAAAPQDELRDGAAALELAQRARDALGETPRVLAVLAAALAESGRPEQALAVQERALAGLPAAEQGSARRALEAYRAGRAWRAETAESAAR